MSPPNKSFFSSLSGLITGIAGLLTATVAVFSVAASQGWLSSGAKSSTAHGTAGSPPAVSSTSNTTIPTTGGGGGGGGTAGDAVPVYAVDPSSVTFPPVGATTAMVKVRNTGLVPMTVQPPQLTGADASHFRAAEGSCAASVDPGRSCQIQVTFNPVPGTSNATLVVQVTGAAQATEVPLTATAIL